MKQWQLGALFAAAGLVVGGSVVWLVTSGDGSTPRAGGTAGAGRSSSAAPGVSANAQELLDRLDDSSKGTFHVRYSTGSTSTSSATLEIWHAGDRVRRDVVAVSSSQGTAHTVEILDGGKFVRCVQFDGKPFQCTGAPTSAASSLTDPLQGAKTDVTGKRVTVASEVIAGQPARCYTVAAVAPAKPSQFCLSKDNVPLRIDGGDGKPVDATDYDTDVPASVFTPPASVAGP